MIRFLADENFNGKVLRGILLLNPLVEIVRAQDTEIYQQADPVVLEWAAKDRLILLTHDVKTMPDFANDRVMAGLPMPGVFVARQSLPVGQVIEELATVAGASEPEEWENRVIYLPL